MKVIKRGKFWITLDGKGKELDRSRQRPSEERSHGKASKGTTRKRKPRSEPVAKSDGV